MRARDAIKLHVGDEVVSKETGESVDVICAFEDVIDGKKVVMIEGTGAQQGYGHWRSTKIK